MCFVCYNTHALIKEREFVMHHEESGELTLSNLSSGVAEELFQREFAKAMENIADINTSATASRRITLTVTIKPNADRLHGSISVKAATSLPSVTEHESPVYFAKVGNVLVAQQPEVAPFQGIFDNIATMPERKAK